AQGGKGEDKEWIPVTTLGPLVKDTKIKSLEGIYTFSLPIRESEITDSFLGASLKDEVLKIRPAQKQTVLPSGPGSRRFCHRDYSGHVGLGVKCSKVVTTTTHGATILAELSMWQAYQGNKISPPNAVPGKVTGCYGLCCAPRGPHCAPRGMVSARVPKKLLMMAGADNCYTSARGGTATWGNFATAIFNAISKTYSRVTPDLWKETMFTKSPYQGFTDHLVKTHTRLLLWPPHTRKIKTE
uniref:Small ribosomal subunit protein uS5 n=1 Tax=Mustela putorius furo TaxID=9669 RepID=M3YW09_MUSPF